MLSRIYSAIALMFLCFVTAFLLNHLFIGDHSFKRDFCQSLKLEDDQWVKRSICQSRGPSWLETSFSPQYQKTVVTVLFLYWIRYSVDSMISFIIYFVVSVFSWTYWEGKKAVAGICCRIVLSERSLYMMKACCIFVCRKLYSKTYIIPFNTVEFAFMDTYYYHIVCVLALLWLLDWQYQCLQSFIRDLVDGAKIALKNARTNIIFLWQSLKLTGGCFLGYCAICSFMHHTIAFVVVVLCLCCYICHLQYKIHDMQRVIDNLRRRPR